MPWNLLRCSRHEIRDEKVKVLQALRPGGTDINDWVVRGQYVNGTVAGQPVPGYRNEPRIDPGSNRETFVAMRVGVDNWRWAGVPFLLRTGKRLARRATEIAIRFKHPPLNLFKTVECEGDLCELVEARPNELVLRIQPREAIFFRFSTKRPGLHYQIQPVSMDFEYQDAFKSGIPDAYASRRFDVVYADRRAGSSVALRHAGAEVVGGQFGPAGLLCCRDLGPSER